MSNDSAGTPIAQGLTANRASGQSAPVTELTVPAEYLVYCTYCNKTHAVRATDNECYPGAWLDPSPIAWPPA